MFHKASQAQIDAKAYVSAPQVGAPVEAKPLVKKLKRGLHFQEASDVLFRFLRDWDEEADKLWFFQQLALCVSRNQDVSANIRHDYALNILREHCGLDQLIKDGAKTGDEQETLGIAGGIYKRKWEDEGDRQNLTLGRDCYRKAHESKPGIAGDNGYNGINLAFLLDIEAGMPGPAPEDQARMRAEARKIRQQIADELPSLAEQIAKEKPKDDPRNGWWYHATLIEAFVGLGRPKEAEEQVRTALKLPNVDFWEYETTARQIVKLARLHKEPLVSQFREVITQLLMDLDGEAQASDAQRQTAKLVSQSIFMGRLGLGLSGGGFRASFFHLGVLARMAELDLLRHVSHLSCVSGGSIVGAAYYLLLQRKLEAHKGETHLSREDYLELVYELIQVFTKSVSTNVRGKLLRTTFQNGTGQLSWFRKIPLLAKLLWSNGVLNTTEAAELYEEHFYWPIAGKGPQQPIYLDQLNFSPDDHKPDWRQQGDFNPKRHNWRRADKVPALCLNATTVNTGHNWQFTTTSMGEAPAALINDLNNVARLRRIWYSRDRADLRVRLGTAVAASSAVPGVFTSVVLPGLYQMPGEPAPFDVHLVDGGVYDNQGTASLLAQDCNIIIASDAGGEMDLLQMARKGDKESSSIAVRTILTLMERVRQSIFADLKTRVKEQRLRACLIAHTQAGTERPEVDPVGEPSKQPLEQPENPRTACDIRKDFQKAIAEIRVDLDSYNSYETRALMACGYQVFTKEFEKNSELSEATGHSHGTPPVSKRWNKEWPFAGALAVITDPAKTDPLWLDMIREGKKRFSRLPAKKINATSQPKKGDGVAG